jgi:voltage-gated potassium channel
VPAQSDYDDEDKLREYRQIQRNFRLVGAIAVGALGIGAVFYHYTEKLSWLDSIYFCTITLATVGYGDIVPHTPLGKMFTVFYVLIGIGIVATFANLLLRNANARRNLKRYSSNSSNTKHQL